MIDHDDEPQDGEHLHALASCENAHASFPRDGFDALSVQLHDVHHAKLLEPLLHELHGRKTCVILVSNVLELKTSEIFVKVVFQLLHLLISCEQINHELIGYAHSCFLRGGARFPRDALVDARFTRELNGHLKLPNVPSGVISSAIDGVTFDCVAKTSNAPRELESLPFEP